jgi:hypothetical protein
MTRYYDDDYYAVRRLTTAELERTKRDLQASAGLITPDSPVHTPIRAYIQAIDAELAKRAGNQQASEDKCHDNERLPGPPSPPRYPSAGRFAGQEGT